MAFACIGTKWTVLLRGRAMANVRMFSAGGGDSDSALFQQYTDEFSKKAHTMPLRSRFPDFPFVNAPVHEFVLAEVDKQTSSRVALLDTSSGRSIKYGEIRGITEKIAAGLHGQGVSAGHVVTLCLPNCIEYPLLLMACYANGAMVSTINANFTPDEYYDHFENAGSRFVFGTVTNATAVIRAVERMQNPVKRIFIVGEWEGGNVPVAPVVPLASLMQAASGLRPAAIRPKVDVAWMPSSSGTTGKPKCLMVSHFNVVGMIQVFGNPHFPQLTAGQYVIGQLPMYHMYGFTVMWMSLVKGATMLVMPKFQQAEYLKLVQKYKVPILYIVPPILVFLAKHPMVDQFDISSVHTLVVRSAPISKELSEETMKRHTSVKYLLQAFGMSEIGAAMMVPPCPPDQVRHGSCGQLMPNFQAKIMDTGTGKELGPNESGELYLKSQTRMLGYWKNEKATAEAIDQEGWLRTGDVAYYDRDGYFFIVDRLKEMIKVNAYQVAPAELEGILLSHPAVQDAAVYGISHDQYGQVPRAVVVKKAGASLTQDDLMSYVHGKIAPYKRLRGGIEFMETIAKSPSGKILRRVLRDEYMKQRSVNSKL